jgi:hypothetical protein
MNEQNNPSQAFTTLLLGGLSMQNSPLHETPPRSPGSVTDLRAGDTSHQVSTQHATTFAQWPGEVVGVPPGLYHPIITHEPRQLTLPEALWHSMSTQMLEYSPVNTKKGLHIIRDIQTGTLFTSDHVRMLWDLRGYELPTRGFWGALITGAHKAGLITPTGKRVPSSFLHSHGRRIDEWRRT